MGGGRRAVSTSCGSGFALTAGIPNIRVNSPDAAFRGSWFLGFCKRVLISRMGGWRS